MDKQYLIIFVLGLTVLAGCESTTPLHIPDKAARLQYLQTNPVENEVIRTAMEKGQVVPGMTKAQVESVWGEPAGRGINRWDYRGMRNIYILFKDGIVTAVKFYTP